MVMLVEECARTADVVAAGHSRQRRHPPPTGLPWSGCCDSRAGRAEAIPGSVAALVKQLDLPHGDDEDGYHTGNVVPLTRSQVGLRDVQARWGHRLGY